MLVKELKVILDSYDPESEVFVESSEWGPVKIKRHKKTFVKKTNDLLFKYNETSNELDSKEIILLSFY